MRLRDGVSTADDYNILSAPFQVRANYDFQQAVRLFPTRQSVAEHHISKLVALDVPVVTFECAHNKAQAKTTSSDEAGGLEQWLSLAVGANIMLQSNLWVQKGLVNGTVGTVLHIIFHNQGPPAMPAVVICQFPSYTGPSFLPGTAGAFPVTPITRTWTSGNSTFSRTGIPLSLSWALTIHKCLGLTLDRAVVDIGDHDTSVGLSFVALSRARSLQHLLWTPFPLDRISRLGDLPSMIQRKRQENRLRQQ